MDEKTLSIFVAFASMVFILLALLHGVYFNIRHQKKLDMRLMGNKYFDGGFLYNYIFRMSLYGTACIFPSFVRFIPNVDRQEFRKISKKLKIHLVLNEILLLFLGFGLLALSAVIDIFS